MFELRRRERILRDSTPSSLDRFVLGLAIFSALTLFGTLAMLCTVVGLAGLLLFSDFRLQSTVALSSPPQVVSPLEEPSPTPVADSPLPPPTPTPEPLVESIPPPTSELPTPIPEQPIPEQPVPEQPIPEQPIPEQPGENPPELPPQPPPVEVAPSPTPVISFLDALTAQLVNFNNALNLLDGMLINPQIEDGGWQLQVRTQHDILRQNYNDILNASAPAELNDLHTRSVNATQLCTSIVFTIENAIANNDVAMIQQGMADLKGCMPQVRDLLNEIGNLQSNPQP